MYNCWLSLDLAFPSGRFYSPCTIQPCTIKGPVCQSPIVTSHWKAGVVCRSLQGLTTPHSILLWVMQLHNVPVFVACGHEAVCCTSLRYTHAGRGETVYALLARGLCTDHFHLNSTLVCNMNRLSSEYQLDTDMCGRGTYRVRSIGFRTSSYTSHFLAMVLMHSEPAEVMLQYSDACRLSGIGQSGNHNARCCSVLSKLPSLDRVIRMSVHTSKRRVGHPTGITCAIAS